MDETATPDGGYSTIDEDHKEDARNSVFAPSIRGFPWIAAGIGGAITLLIQYVMVAALFVIGPASVGEKVTTTMRELTIYGFVLFGSHNVPIVRSVQGDFINRGARQVNIVTGQENTAVPVFVYLLIPIVTLLFAAAAFEWWRSESPEETLYEGAILVGIGFVPGYLIFGLLGSVIFVWTTAYEFGGTLVRSANELHLFVAMVVYPLLLATIGALGVRLYRAKDS